MKSLWRNSVSILVLILFSTTLYGKKHSFKGVIWEEGTSEPVSYANVYIKELKGGISADLQGYFHINLSEGEYNFRVSSIGYETLDTLISIHKDTEIALHLKQKQETLEQVVVIAKESKALATTSTIKQDALRHLQPNSFSDILELIPGGISMNRGMTSMNLISLRQPIASASLSNSSNEHNTSLGTAFIIDGLPISNDAQLQNVSGAPRYANTSEDFIFYRNTTGKGIDMRMLSTDDIERVDIVRGIPSVRYGDLTSGMVNIKRNYKKAPLKIRAKANPSVKLFALGKGIKIGENTLNTNIDYVNYIADPRNEKVNYSRMTASLRFANKRSTSKPLQYNVNVDYTGSFDDSKKDKENDISNEFYKNSYNQIRFGGTLSRKKQNTLIDIIRYRFTGSYTHEKNTIQRMAVGRQSPILTERTEGEFYGKYLPASYKAHLVVDGKPVFLFSSLEAQAHWDFKNIRNKIYMGVEWRYKKNLGEGQVYDIERPLYAGVGRPRRSKDIPAMQDIAIYAEDNVSIPIQSYKINLQTGVRASSLLCVDKSYTNLYNTLYFDPRVNLSLDFPTMKLLGKEIEWTLKGGIGWHTKLPTLSHLYPSKNYYDEVQLNYYSQNQSLRQMQYIVKIIDPTNFTLKPNRNSKWEVGISMKSGKTRFDATFYRETMREGYKHLSNFDFIHYKKYDVNTGPSPSQITVPPTVDMFSYKNHKDFIFYSQYTNGGVEEKRGVEYQLDLGNISVIKSDVSINGAYMQMKYAQSLPRYSSSSVILNRERYPYIGYYEWGNRNDKEYQQFNTNFRLDTKIDKLGLIFSSTFQVIWFTQWKYIPNNGMPSRYLDKDGNSFTYTEKDATDPILGFLYTKHSPNEFDIWKVPVTVDYNLKVSKTINKNMLLAFYVNRILYYYPDYNRKDGFRVRRDASPYFGMELNIKI